MAVYTLDDLEQLDVPQKTSDYYAQGSRMEFTVYQPSQSEEKAVTQPVQSVKKKKSWLIWLLVAALVMVIIAQPIVFSLLNDGKGIAGTEINQFGELIIHYSDGSMDNLGVVVGKDGMDGADGMDGSNSTGDIVQNPGNIALATSTGLRSSVSIFCGFGGKSLAGQTYYSAGSGVIYKINKTRGDAFIITNYHVVFDPDTKTNSGISQDISVYLYGSEVQGMEIPARYVGGSQNYDIAILRIENSELLRESSACAITPGNSDLVQVGSTAIAIGNPEGMGISASSGVISVDSEYIDMTAADGRTAVSYRVMRMDTAVNSGNSGGGLFDDQGRLIGIVNAKIMTDDVENIGYALPSTTVFAVADNIIDYCDGTNCKNVMRPILGVTVVTKSSSGVYNPQNGSMLIFETVEVMEVSANQIGSVFQVGDVFRSITLHGQTTQITRQHQVIDTMITARVGDEVTFEVMRGGKVVTLKITVTEECLTVS